MPVHMADVERSIDTFEPAYLRDQIRKSWDEEPRLKTVEQAREVSAAQMPFHFWEMGDAYSRYMGVARAAVEGIGIAPLPCFAAAQESGLVRITPEIIGERDITLVVHPDLVRVARVRATMDFLTELLHREAALWSGRISPPTG